MSSTGWGDRLPKPRHLGLAALSGLLATVALWRSPLWATTPMLLYPPWVPIDARLLLPALGFATALAIGHLGRWPWPAASLPATAVASGALAHLHASAVLAFLGVATAAPGTRIDLLGLAASVGSILLALQVSLEQAGDRFEREARAVGVPDQDLGEARRHGAELRRAALGTAALASAVLALGVRIGDQLVGGERVPLPEVVALAVVLALGVVLLGVRGRWMET